MQRFTLRQQKQYLRQAIFSLVFRGYWGNDKQVESDKKCESRRQQIKSRGLESLNAANAEMASYSVVYFSSILAWPSSFDPYQKAALLSGKRVRLAIRHPLVQIFSGHLLGLF